MAFDRPPTNWLAIPEVARQLDLAAQEVACVAADRYKSLLAEELDESKKPQSTFDSPLEAIFFLWWRNYEAINPNAAYRYVLVGQERVEINGEWFRPDFSIYLDDAGLLKKMADHGVRWPRIAVELDGHGFHERTREQVARRDYRDRALQQAGWTVFHFSWAEMTAEPARCLNEVVFFIQVAYGRMFSECEAKERAERAASAESSSESV